MDKKVYEKFYECQGISNQDKSKVMKYLYGASPIDKHDLHNAVLSAKNDRELTIAFKGFVKYQGYSLNFSDVDVVDENDVDVTEPKTDAYAQAQLIMEAGTKGAIVSSVEQMELSRKLKKETTKIRQEAELREERAIRSTAGANISLGAAGMAIDNVKADIADGCI